MLQQIKVTQAITPTNGAAGTANINGATLNMANFGGALGIVTFGVITAGALTTVKVQEGAASDGSDMADLLGSGQTVADTDDASIVVVDFGRVRKQYARLVVTRSTQNAVVAAAEYVQHTPRRAPTTQDTTVSHSKEISGVAEGTA